jgi:hypothetical protein
MAVLHLLPDAWGGRGRRTDLATSGADGRVHWLHRCEPGGAQRLRLPGTERGGKWLGHGGGADDSSLSWKALQLS